MDDDIFYSDVVVRQQEFRLAENERKKREKNLWN
jgi:hypothetical protein